MAYRCVCPTLDGFVQQLACNILPHGYWFYVRGEVPEGKDPDAVDAKLIERYGIDVSRQTRARRKQAGSANLHYLRHGSQFVLLATHGRHDFFKQEEGSIRDARKTPVRLGGYSIRVAKRGVLRAGTEADDIDEAVYQSAGGLSVDWVVDRETSDQDSSYRVRVLIEGQIYLNLKAHMTDIAAKRSSEAIEKELRSIRFQPYAPVRRQLLRILQSVNRARREAGLEAIGHKILRLRRTIVRPFETPPQIIDAVIPSHVS